jgi:hypothetical protein
LINFNDDVVDQESDGDIEKPKKKKRRRKNRKRAKRDDEVDDDEIEDEDDIKFEADDTGKVYGVALSSKVINLEYVDEGSTQCISKLSEDEFDKNFI